MPDKKESLQVSIMTLICSIVMIIPIFVWWNQTLINMRNWLFCVVDLVLVILFTLVSRKCFKQVREYETETTVTRATVIFLAVADFIWIAGWAAYQNELIK